ncbi:MAG: outer membrane lipoprotein carrier protein LolA [Silvanigrellaceae bacterium]|nr:outer membrane lipoprotein carrier protein LolA [Silvanigrellaceae bacterium]
MVRFKGIKTMLGQLKYKWIVFVFLLPLLSFANKENIQNKNSPEHHILKRQIGLATSNALKKKYLTMQFTQEFYSFLRKKSFLSEGILKLSPPNLFHWEIVKPRSEIYVSNGKDFWKYIPSLKHAQHLNAQSNELNFIQILSDFNSIFKHYHVTLWTDAEAKSLRQPKNLAPVESEYPPEKQEKEKLYLKLNPLGDKHQKVLYAILDVKSGLINELRAVQLNGNRTRILFTYKDDKTIPLSEFNFVPPKGIAVDTMPLGD